MVSVDEMNGPTAGVNGPLLSGCIRQHSILPMAAELEL